MHADEDFPTERKKVFLDLDNTLISSVPTKEFSINDPSTKERALKMDFHNMDDYYIIFERPGLQEFLDYLFANFDVNIWSAASKDYVAFIANNIVLKDKPDRKLGYVLFSYQCDLSRKLYDDGIKDLRLVWDDFQVDGFSPENTVIIDDLKKVKKINGENCLAVIPFEFTKDGADKDEDLKRIKERLEEFKKAGVSSREYKIRKIDSKSKYDDEDDDEEVDSKSRYDDEDDEEEVDTKVGRTRDDDEENEEEDDSKNRSFMSDDDDNDDGEYDDDDNDTDEDDTDDDEYDDDTDEYDSDASRQA